MACLESSWAVKSQCFLYNKATLFSIAWSLAALCYRKWLQNTGNFFVLLDQHILHSDICNAPRLVTLPLLAIQSDNIDSTGWMDVLESRVPGPKSWLYYFLVWWLCRSCLTSLYLNILIYKISIVTTIQGWFSWYPVSK